MFGCLRKLGVIVAGAGLAVVFGAFRPAFAQSEPGHVAPSPDSIWQTATTPEGGVSWATLAKTKEIAVEGSWSSRAEFPDDVLALDGQTVVMNGFMEPLTYGRRQSHFILMAYPKDCPFCLTVGPTQLAEVFADPPVNATFDMITVEGVMELLDGAGESADGGFFFRLTAAERIKR